MSAFAALADELEGARPKAAPPARGTGSFSEFNISPETQRGRDDERVKILRSELAQERDPKLRADIQLEIDRTAGGAPYGRPAATAAPAAAPKSAFASLADDLEAGGGSAPAPTRTARAPVREAPIAGQEEPGFLDRMGSAIKAAVPQTVGEVLDPMYGHKVVGEIAAQQASGIGQAIVGGWRGLTALASGAGLDEAVRQVHAPELAGGARAETYQPTTRAGAAGVELAGAPGEGIAYVAKKAGQGAMEVTGSPAVATAVETGITAAPMALMRGQGSKPAFGGEPKLVGSGSIADAAPAAIEATANLDVPTYLRRKQGAAVAEPVPAQPAARTASAPESAKPGPSVFERPDATPQETAAAAVKEAPKFTDAAPEAPAGKSLPKPDVARREAVLKEVGIADARRSAVEGNPAEARVDFDASRSTGPIGDFARAKLDAERAALTNYAEKIVADTKGSVGTDTSALYSRGDTIAKPFQGLKNWFDKNTKTLYAEADKRAGGVPMELGNLKSVLGEESAFAGSTEGTALRKGIESRMRELKMIDKDGNALPATVEQAERLKQYLNDQWSPRTSRLISKVKDGIDTDVLSSAGEDIYAKARAMRAMRSSVFENDILDPQGRTIPNGVAKVFDASGKGIEMLKATEQVPDAIARLPVDELAQIVKTLKSVPPEIQPQAQAALAEIKGQFANRILEAGSKTEGQWGAPGVTKYMNANAARLRLLFNDAELAKLNNLNEAGHILRFGPYPGAAVQSGNLMRSGVARGLEAAGASAGALIGTIVGGPVGTAAGAAGGGLMGRAAGGKLSDAAALRSYQKRFTTLGEIAKGPK